VPRALLSVGHVVRVEDDGGAEAAHRRERRGARPDDDRLARRGLGPRRRGGNATTVQARPQRAGRPTSARAADACSPIPPPAYQGRVDKVVGRIFSDSVDAGEAVSGGLSCPLTPVCWRYESEEVSTLVRRMGSGSWEDLERANIR